MNALLPHPPSKLNWRLIPRKNPPKRAAAQRRRDFDEIYFLYDEAAVREQASRCIQCPKPLCMTGCPLANRIPEWLALAADGKFMEAAQASCATSNMPEICSRVCPQERLCEGACILNARGDPVAIGAVEKFINEYALAHGGTPVALPPKNAWRIAVVGAGPSGLACADELAKAGCAVTVFESLPSAGGLLVYGIPSFKLSKAVVQRRIDLLRERGVCFRFNVRVGRDVSLGQLQADFNAVYLAMGAQQPKKLDAAGADLPGVVDALPFLIEKNLRQPERFDARGKNVAVLGGGDTAMDCLRTALRAGARQAVCIYRRDLANMPGSRKEYENALEEGARFEFLANPLALLGDARSGVREVQCVRMALGDPDASGRRQPRPLPGSEFSIPAEMVIVAFGFDPEPIRDWKATGQLQISRWDTVAVDDSQATTAPGIFSGGDLARGPNLVVRAVRDGRVAAQSILAYFSKANSKI